MRGWAKRALGLLLAALLSGCGGGGGIPSGGAPSDTTPPSLSDIQVTPSQFRFVGGTMTISAKASDPSGIAEVWAEVLKPDGTKERVAMNLVGGVYQGQYKVEANTSNDGRVYKVWVRARDGQGNETPLPGMPLDGIVVTVQAPMSPPSQPNFP